MIIEAIQWLGLESDLKVSQAAQNVSNTLLFLYVISYINIRKGCFVAAFISCELWSYGIFSYWASNEVFYAGYAAVYCLLYFYVKNHISQSVIKLSGIILMILLSIGMIVDAILYPKVKTNFWLSYEINVLLLHCYIIITFIDWRLLRVYMGEGFTAFCRMLGINDAFRFYWYNNRKSQSSIKQ